MSYLKPVVVASTMLVASLSVPAFANYNYAADPHSQASNNLMLIAERNSPRSDVSCFNWDKRIFVSGILNVDAVYSERAWNFFQTPNFLTPDFSTDSVHSSDIVVNNANIFVDAKVNSVTTAHVGLAYTQRPGQFNRNGFSFSGGDDYESPSDYVAVNDPSLGIDEAYITFNDCSSPFYFQAGRKFTAFGNYDPYPITYSLTQLLSQTDEEVLEFGYTSNDGLHGALYVFNGPESGRVFYNHDHTKEQHVESSRINNYGVDFAYSAQYNNLDYNIGVDYVKDIRDTTFIAGQDLTGTVQDDGSRSAPGYAVHADLTTGPFTVMGDFVTAGKQLVVFHPHADEYSKTKAWAYGLQAGYGFDSMGWGSNASIGYQHSGDAFFIGMPHSRVLADYTVEVSKNAKVTLEYAHSQDYKAGVKVDDDTHGTNNSTNTATLRIGVSV